MNLVDNIIINADDFGYKSSVNKAIIDSFEKGYINSTTIMSNMPAFDEAIDLAYQHKITNKIGVHLVLTEGEPLTNDIRELNHLFNNGLSLKMRLKKLFLLKNTTKRLIFKEYSAQIEKVLQKGIKISHIDTHHQIHDLYGIMHILISLLKTYDIPGMRILNNLENSSSFIKVKYRHYCNNYLIKKRVNFTDYLGDQIDFTNAYDKKTFSFNRNKTIEIMVHPDLDEDGNIVDLLGTQKLSLDFLEDRS